MMTGNDEVEQIPLIDDEPEDAAPPEDSIGIPEAAKLVGVSRQTIRQWIKAGKLASFQWEGKEEVFVDELNRIKTLRDKHGVNWADIDADEFPVLNEDSGEPETDGPQTLAQRIACRAKRLKDMGSHEAAAELYSILVEHCSWDEVS